MHEKNAEHYNQITTPWQFILGDNFHWGYFTEENQTLEKATDNLIDKTASYGNLNAETLLLDIGCGIGTPARYLHSKFGCKVNGLSNSSNGVKEANDRSKKAGVQEKVSFFVRDALDNGFETGKFDVAWLMEMSHLIEDKQALVNETYRSIKKGGTTLLCDLTLINPLSAKEIFKMADDLRLLERSFGKASLYTLAQYEELFKKAGYKDVKTVDVSREVIPTLEAWRQNLRDNEGRIRETFSDKEYDGFLQSCHILEKLYVNSRWGYGVVVGKK